MYELEALINDICIRKQTSITKKMVQHTLSVGKIAIRIQHVS